MSEALQVNNGILLVAFPYRSLLQAIQSTGSSEWVINVQPQAAEPTVTLILIAVWGGGNKPDEQVQVRTISHR